MGSDQPTLLMYNELFSFLPKKMALIGTFHHIKTLNNENYCCASYDQSDFKGRFLLGVLSFVYSADAGESPAFEAFAQNCDLLLHWCYRDVGDLSMPSIATLSPDAVQIAQLATRCRAKQLVLTHFRNNMDSIEAYERIIKSVEQNYKSKYCIAEDLMEFELGAGK